VGDEGNALEVALHSTVNAIVLHQPNIVFFLFWAVIGYAVQAPVFAAQTAYRMSQLDGQYDVHGRYARRRRRYRYELRLHAMIFTFLFSVLLGGFIGTWIV
jgi:hypothetical protein